MIAGEEVELAITVGLGEERTDLETILFIKSGARHHQRYEYPSDYLKADLNFFN